MSHFLTLKEDLRSGLIDSYRHKNADDGACAICCERNIPLAFHVLEAYLEDNQKIPEGFVLLSSASSWSRARGSYPVCINCAPPCRKCGLPVKTDKLLNFAHKTDAKYGLGSCQHIRVVEFVAAIFKRIFSLGRFSRKEIATPVKSHEASGEDDADVISVEITEEILEDIAANSFPAANRYVDDDFVKLVYELTWFGMYTIESVHELLDEQLDRVLAADEQKAIDSIEELRAQRLTETYRDYYPEARAIVDAEIERAENGAYATWSELIRNALVRHVGDDKLARCVKDLRQQKNSYY